MSSQTSNLNLVLPVGTEKVSRQIINDNNTKIDTAVGSNTQAITNLNDKFVTETILDCNTYNREGVGRIVETSLNRPFSYGVLKNFTYSLGNYGYRAQVAISVTNQRYVLRTSNDGGTTWSEWKELETAKKYGTGSKTISSIAPNSNGSVMIDMPSDGSAIKEIIPYGFLPATHWTSSLVFVSVNNSTRTIAYRCVGSGNSQAFEIRYAVIYE